MQATRRYTTGFIVVVACFTVFAGVINTWVDPFRLTGQPWANPDFEPYREISSQIRSGKAGMLRQAGHLDAAFVGSSRVANGLDPEFEPWGERQVLNLGCSGGFLFESIAIARKLIKETSTDLIFFGIDPGDLTSSVDTRPLGDFYSSPFNPEGDSIDREIRYWVGISTLEQSFETLERAKLERPATYNSKGLRIRRGGRGATRQLDFIRSNILGEAFLADDSPHAGQLNEKKANALRDLLLEAAESSTRLILYLHPRHALLGADRSDLDTNACPYQVERVALVRLVTEVTEAKPDSRPFDLWDFLDYHPLNTEPLPLDEGSGMSHWSDLDHFSIEVGNAMQSRMLDWPVKLRGASNFGTKLEASNLDEHLATIQAEYQDYLKGAGARDLEWKKTTAGETP